jgi:FAD:protein FMN transferase
MKDTKIIMGMPITVEIVDLGANIKNIDKVFDYFKYVDQKFSTYKKGSEITKINRGLIGIKNASNDMKEVLALCEKTKQETNGYFDIMHQGKLDPSGLVKGWAINNAANLISNMGFKNFFIDAGGDIQVKGKNKENDSWKIGIQNPFNLKEIIKVIWLKNKGVATSGTYIRGQHVYDPYHPRSLLQDIVSITVIGPNVYEADRFATAAFAMGQKGINFIENLSGFEGYTIDRMGTATYTSGFDKYVLNT